MNRMQNRRACCSSMLTASLTLLAAGSAHAAPGGAPPAGALRADETPTAAEPERDRASAGGALDAGELHLETDPATFAFDGYALHLRFAPRSTPGWVFGAGAYAMDLPSPMVELDPENRDEGWQSRIDLGIGAFVDRYFSGTEGAFVGVQVAHQRFRLRRDDFSGEEHFDAGLVMARIGYLWRPARELGLYVMPWAGVGATAPLSGERRIGDERYRVLPAVAFATLHVGWRI